MDESSEQHKDLVHLARLALSGRQQDVQTYIVRMARKYRKTAPLLAEELGNLAKEAPTRSSPLRNESVAAIPVDKDSRLQLLRHEEVPEIDHAIWAPAVGEKLGLIVAEHKRSSELLDSGLTPTRTAIFTGPPGVGKTLAAHWLAHQLDRPLLTLDLSAVMSSFLGRTGANVRHVLDFAKGVSCVLLLDELDAIAKRRDDLHEVGELKRLVTVLLQEIDDWPAGGLLVAATNHAELLDPAVWRRFEALIEFPLPDSSTLREALSAFLGESNDIGDEWLQVLTVIFEGISFSDIEREISSVRRQAVIHGQPIGELLSSLVRRHIGKHLPLARKKEIALKLGAAGVSQRQINDLTGLSRDTIRKLDSGDGLSH